MRVKALKRFYVGGLTGYVAVGEEVDIDPILGRSYIALGVVEAVSGTADVPPRKRKGVKTDGTAP